jgi:DNA-binding transcriptional ArsR family regulator
MFYHVVERMTSTLDATYAALADPTRRAILARLRTGEARVTDIAADFPVSLNAVSTPLAEAGTWIADYRSFWEQRADALARHVERRSSR